MFHLVFSAICQMFKGLQLIGQQQEIKTSKAQVLHE